MQVLNANEVEQVSGALSSDTLAGMGLTIGLMALAPASPFVIGVGTMALGSYIIFDSLFY